MFWIIWMLERQVQRFLITGLKSIYMLHTDWIGKKDFGVSLVFLSLSMFSWDADANMLKTCGELMANNNKSYG